MVRAASRSATRRIACRPMACFRLLPWRRNAPSTTGRRAWSWRNCSTKATTSRKTKREPRSFINRLATGGEGTDAPSWAPITTLAEASRLTRNGPGRCWRKAAVQATARRALCWGSRATPGRGTQRLEGCCPVLRDGLRSRAPRGLQQSGNHVWPRTRREERPGEGEAPSRSGLRVRSGQRRVQEDHRRK
jgi:hypothetical protein